MVERGYHRHVEQLRRFVLRTQAGWLRPLWAVGYEASARLVAAALIVGVRGSAAHVRGSLGAGDPVYGASDIDLAIVVGGAADRDRVLSRWRRLERLPVVSSLFGPPRVCRPQELAASARGSVLTWGLDAGRQQSGTALYNDPDLGEETVRSLERPGLRGPVNGWRRLAGPAASTAPALATGGGDPQQRRVAAWLELQFVWRSAYRYCAHPDWRSGATVPAKLVADSARILLSLTEEGVPKLRRESLRAAAAAFPDQAGGLSEASEWLSHPHVEGISMLSRAVPICLRLADLIAGQLEADLADHGTLAVRLEGGGEPALPLGGWKPPEGLRGSGPPLPLADWRALVRPALPDEVSVEVEANAADPRSLGALARAAVRGPQPLLRSESTLLLPAEPWWRGALRAIQCRLTDPVTIALLEGSPTARFTDARGWSITDAASRAVAEHAAWIGRPELRPDHRGTALGATITAARAALLEESCRCNEPVLPLTAAATMRLLADQPGARDAAEATAEAYDLFARTWEAPGESLVEAMRGTVLALPAYTASPAAAASATAIPG